SAMTKIIVCFSLALALLSTVSVALLPATLSKYRNHQLSDSGLEALPYGDARLGLDRAAKMIPPVQSYHRAWPDRIARVSRKLKHAVWGQGVQVYITVEISKDSTIIRFLIPSTGTNACALSWRPPPPLSGHAKDIITKGDVTEIEVWQLIAPSSTATADSPNMSDLNFDTLSYSSFPVRGELIGVIDITAQPNSTTGEFACPGEGENLTVEMRCQRVVYHVSFMQIDMAPRFGFGLLRRSESEGNNDGKLSLFI
ncbi:hypothetical protein DM02DRAFT_544377, partial [Periconia macrospinosa]